MIKKKKVTLVLPSLAAGGAEKVTSLVAQKLNKSKFDVSLLIIGNSKDSCFKVADIPIIYLNEKRIRNAFFKIYRYIRKNKPEVVISSIGHTNSLMSLIATFFPNTKFIGRITNMHLPTGSKYKVSSLASAFFNKIQKVNLDKFICQSEDMKNTVIGHYQFPSDKIVVINNPINAKFALKTKKRSDDVLKLITVGRLAKIKGHMRVIEILAEVKFDFCYTIIGTGPELESVLERAKELNIFNKIRHIDFTDKINEHLSDSDIFLQGSYSEGFPNALLESCAVGTPVLAFTAPGGTKEIVVNGINGYIANTPKEYIEYLTELKNNMLNDPKVVRNSVINRFTEEIIINKYENLIYDVLS